MKNHLRNLFLSACALLSLNSAFAQQYSLNFDGADDRVFLGDLNPISEGVNGEYTVELWVNPDGYNGSFYADFIFGNERNYNRGIMVAMGSNGGLRTFHPSPDRRPLTPPALAYGSWTHIAYVQNASSLSVYVNGNFFATLLSAPLHQESSSNDYIGAFTGNEISFSRFFRGSLDELRIWNYARSEEQIQDNMMFEDLQQPGLVAGYSFNIPSDPVLDYSSGGNDGIRQGAFGANNLPQYQTNVPPLVSASAIIPTVSEWGLVFLFLGFLSVGSAWMYRRKENTAIA
jgi:hypothetical protein